MAGRAFVRPGIRKSTLAHRHAKLYPHRLHTLYGALSTIMTESGLRTIFLANQDRLLRFLAAQGAGDDAEDLLQELWLKVAAVPSQPIDHPLSYLYRAANNLMLDRYRSRRQAQRRDSDWTEAATSATGQSDDPSAERAIIARQHLHQVERELEALGARTAAIFRRHRVDGVAQKTIAQEHGVSVSTVESDLRRAYRTMIDLRRRLDEE
jgi:RNA polymerase sigma-70 factor (ECF subfamily)